MTYRSFYSIRICCNNVKVGRVIIWHRREVMLVYWFMKKSSWEYLFILNRSWLRSNWLSWMIRLNSGVGSKDGRLSGNGKGEIEAWHGHSWSERRDYISLYIYWVVANWYSFVETFKTKNGHSFWLYCPCFIILKPFES